MREATVFDAERAPVGNAGLFLWRPSGAVDVSDCLCSTPKPWWLVVWEPLRTLAPSPARCAPHCCYINTVIFYARPHVVRPFSRLWRDARGRWRAEKSSGFEEYGRTETRLRWDDAVQFNGEWFNVEGGSVVWSRRRWWMRSLARRAQLGASDTEQTGGQDG